MALIDNDTHPGEGWGHICDDCSYQWRKGTIKDDTYEGGCWALDYSTPKIPESEPHFRRYTGKEHDMVRMDSKYGVDFIEHCDMFKNAIIATSWIQKKERDILFGLLKMASCPFGNNEKIKCTVDLGECDITECINHVLENKRESKRVGG